MSCVRVAGKNLDPVLSFARKDTKLSPMIRTITHAHAG